MSEFGITEQDRKKLGELASGQAHPNSSTGGPHPEFPDPATRAPSWEGQNKLLNRCASIALIKHAHEHTNRDASDHFGVAEQTVERHRNLWRDDTQEARFVGTYITAPRCAVMREMAHDGKTIQWIADWHDVARGTVHRHVASGAECQHESRVPRVELGEGVPSALCDRMRKQAKRGKTGPEIAETVPLTRKGVNYHVSANQECGCENEIAPVEY